MEDINKSDKYQINSAKGSSVSLSGEDLDNLDLIRISENKYHLIADKRSYEATILSCNLHEKRIHLEVNGKRIELSIKDKYDILVDKMGLKTVGKKLAENLQAPMPGLVLDIMVENGQKIQKGDQILILEAMKMENIIKAPVDTTIDKIEVRKGETVDKGQILISFKLG